MVQPIGTWINFVAHFARIRKSSKTADYFGFFLFSSRTSHHKASSFAKKQTPFFQEIARRHNIWIFYFDPDSIKPKPKILENPSAEISAMFGVDFSELPGLLFFSMHEDLSEPNGVFLPISLSAFENEGSNAEQIILRMFSEFSASRTSSINPADTFKKMKEKIGTWKRRSQLQPFVLYIRETGISLLRLPTVFLEALTKKYGDKIGS